MKRRTQAKLRKLAAPVTNPFVSEAQRRACYAADDPAWDCATWQAHTPAGKLPARKKGRVANRLGKTLPRRVRLAAFLANARGGLLKRDPTRLTTTRRAFIRDLKGRLDRLRAALWGYVVRDGALGLRENPAANIAVANGLAYNHDPEGDYWRHGPTGTCWPVVRNATWAEIQVAASTAHPNPTDAQREAGNYRKGHVVIQGIPVTIETAAGVKRRPHHTAAVAFPYGYVKRTESAADGDAVDVFLGPHPDSDAVFVIDQTKGGGGAFDEHKAMLGFLSTQEAEAAYRASYPEGWDGLGDVTELTVAEFKDWLESGDTGKPVKDQWPVVNAAWEQEERDGRGRWVSGVSPEEGKALAEWATDVDRMSLIKDLHAEGGSGDAMRSYGFDEDTVRDAEELYRQFRAGWEHSPTYEGELYRGAGGVDLSNFPLGEEVGLPDYTSLAKREDSALTYAVRKPTGLVIFKVNSTTARDISDAVNKFSGGKAAGWDEVLTAPGARYRVAGVEPHTFSHEGKNYQGHRVILQEIPWGQAHNEYNPDEPRDERGRWVGAGAVLAKLGAAGKWMKDKAQQVFTRLEGRYGRKSAVAIMVSGQAIGWGATAVGAAFGVPVWLPGSTIWGAAPGAAIAEVIKQASRGVKYLTGNVEGGEELSKEEIERLARAVVAELKAAWAAYPRPTGNAAWETEERDNAGRWTAGGEGVSPSEAQASVAAYVEGEAYDLNKKLRNGEPLGAGQQKMLKYLDSAVKGTDVGARTLLRGLDAANGKRLLDQLGFDYAEYGKSQDQLTQLNTFKSLAEQFGMSGEQSRQMMEAQGLNPNAAADFSRAASAPVGKEVRDKGFLSTSTTWAGATHYRGGEGTSGKTAVVLELRTKDGQKGLDVDKFLGRDKEANVVTDREILLPRGSTFRIRSIGRERDFGWRVTADAVQSTTANLAANAAKGVVNAAHGTVAAFKDWLDRQVRAAFGDCRWADIYLTCAYLAGANRSFDQANASRHVGRDAREVAGAREQFLRQLATRKRPVHNVDPLRDVGGRFMSEEVSLLAERLENELSNATTDLSQKIARAVIDGVSRDLKPSSVMSEIDRVTGVGYTRARLIANTELTRAHATAQLDALGQLGGKAVAVEAEWVTGDNPCPACDDLDGVVMPIDDARDLIPRHPGCLCSWSAADPDEPEEGQVRGAEADEAVEESLGEADWPALEAEDEEEEERRGTRNLAVANYSPDQPRNDKGEWEDDKGQWTAGGEAGTPEHVRSVLDQAAKDTGVPAHTFTGEQAAAVLKAAGYKDMTPAAAKLFLPPAPAAQITPASVATAVSKLAAQTSHGTVSLADLHDALGGPPVAAMHEAVQQLRGEGKLAVLQHEGRHGITAREEKTAIHGRQLRGERTERITAVYLTNEYNPNEPRVPAGSPEGGQWGESGGAAERAGRAELNKVQALARAKAAEAPRPTAAERAAAKAGVAALGANRFRRNLVGNTDDRRKRREALLTEFGDGKNCPCVYCGLKLGEGGATLEQDKIYTTAEGGRYRTPNLVPACGSCNKNRSDTKWKDINW